MIEFPIRIRYPCSTFGASAFGTLIYGLIGGTQDLRMMQGALVQTQVRSAFQVAFFAAAAICVLAAWTASRIPALDFTDEVGEDTPSVE